MLLSSVFHDVPYVKACLTDLQKVLGQWSFLSSFLYGNFYTSYKANIISSIWETSFLKNVREKKAIFVSFFFLSFSPHGRKMPADTKAWYILKQNKRSSKFPKLRKESCKRLLRQISGTQHISKPPCACFLRDSSEIIDDFSPSVAGEAGSFHQPLSCP